jgi:hypothetical protein
VCGARAETIVVPTRRDAPTRHFFRKAVAPAPKPPTMPRPNHRQKNVMGVRLDAFGVRQHRVMSSRQAAVALGTRKGGLHSAAKGVAHRWTSEGARKAALKSWKRRKFNRRINARVGMKAKRRPPLWREPLRVHYAATPTRGIWYDLALQQWFRWVADPDGGDPTKHRLSERAALTALGHLPSKAGYIPDTVTPVIRKKR